MLEAPYFFFLPSLFVRSLFYIMQIIADEGRASEAYLDANISLTIATVRSMDGEKIHVATYSPCSLCESRSEAVFLKNEVSLLAPPNITELMCENASVRESHQHCINIVHHTYYARHRLTLCNNLLLHAIYAHYRISLRTTLFSHSLARRHHPYTPMQLLIQPRPPSQSSSTKKLTIAAQLKHVLAYDKSQAD